MNKEMKQLVKQLHEGKHSCVILTAGGDTYTCNRRGVADLYEIYRTMPEVLEGATVADKVIGKGAAALLALGKVKAAHGDVVSEPAMALLRAAGVKAEAGEVAPHIINRTGTGRCPLETACDGLETPEEIYPAIVEFVNNLKIK